MNKEAPIKITYPDLPVSRFRKEILEAMGSHQVVVVVGETGSGKTTQLPKMAMELAKGAKADVSGIVGCTQPRRLAAASVSRRVAEELGTELGDLVGYQVRFDERVSERTELKFMTDGILLAETQADPDLRKYHTLVLDEAHERSLNIDFLLGYLKLLLQRRPDLHLIISSATLDAGGFAEFFDGAPIIFVEGRTFPVEMHYLPPIHQDEELPEHVSRAVRWLDTLDDHGDVLVFLPGEREIRDVADKLVGMNLRGTDILPLFARLGLVDQQKIFHPKPGRRRIVLATNVAETSLTIPGIIYVIDSGVARVSRYSPARQVQRLQIESISQASARQRAGRCGRVCEGVCIRLYSEEDYEERPEFTDPEIKRSALAGALLRMKDLGLPEMADFPLPDPPSERLVTEGYRTLREVGALDQKKALTHIGKKLARLPIDPRLGRMVIEAVHEQALPEILVLVAGLSVMDPRERPSEAAQQADSAHAQWKHEDSDFMGMLALWRDIWQFREGRQWKKNQLRKWCGKNFLNMMRILEWVNLWEDLSRLVKETLRIKVPPLETEPDRQAAYAMIHRSILSGVPRQFGLWDPENREYKGVGGRQFAVFPGSGLFRRKNRCEWVMGVELVDTTRLWMRRAAKLEPEWVEQVSPHLCQSHYSQVEWNKEQGAVYAKERVVCGGLPIIQGRKVHYGRINPEQAREVMIREGLMMNRLRNKPDYLKHLASIKEEIQGIELKLRRPDQVWCEEGVYEFFDRKIPATTHTAKALLRWYGREKEKDPQVLHVPIKEAMYTYWGQELLSGFPDEITCEGMDFPVYYQYDPGAADDGVTLGVHIDQLPHVPDWLPDWGMPGHMVQRIECLLRSASKDVRLFLQPISQKAQYFAELLQGVEPKGPLTHRLAELVRIETNRLCHPSSFDVSKLPAELVTKIWVCDDEGKELALGTDVAELKKKLTKKVSKRFEETALDIVYHTGLKSWSIGQLERKVDVNGRPGFVGMVDEGTTVGVKLFESEAAAEDSHRHGVVRLLSMFHVEQINHLRKKFPLQWEGKLALHSIGVAPATNMQDLLDVAVESTMRLSLPYDEVAFEACRLSLRENIFDEAKKVGEVWELIATADHYVRDFIQANGTNKHYIPVIDDLNRQMKWLTRTRFMKMHGAKRLGDIKRYMQGIMERLKRIDQQPIAKELERIQTFNRSAEVWSSQWESHLSDIRWLEYGYMLEEYRLSVFAPMIAIKGKVSEKRLSKLWEEIIHGS